jgi:hypothetical protein
MDCLNRPYHPLTSADYKVLVGIWCTSGGVVMCLWALFVFVQRRNQKKTEIEHAYAEAIRRIQKELVAHKKMDSSDLLENGDNE